MAQSPKQQAITDEVLKSSAALITKLLPTLTGEARKASEDRLAEIQATLQVGKKSKRRAS